MTPTAAKQPQTPQNGNVVTVSNERSVEFKAFGSDLVVRLTVPMVRDFLAAKTKSGAMATDVQLVKFMMLCRSRCLNPFEGDAYLVGYDSKDGPVFNLVTAHQAFLKRAELHPEFDGMESGVIVKEKASGNVVDREGSFRLDDDVLLGAWAVIHFKKRKHEMRKRVRLAAFRKNFGRWLEDPEGMIVKCFDEETEVLTTNGFEKFAEATGHVLQVSENGLQPTDAQPFMQSYSGPMVTLDSDDLNFCVTPNHDMLTTAGKIEAGQLFDKAQSRAKFWIPRCVQGCSLGYGMSMDAIKLAAVYLADGYDRKHGDKFEVAVSREYKVEMLESLGMHASRYVQKIHVPKQRQDGKRVPVQRKEKQAFAYDFSIVSPLVHHGKLINTAALLSLSRAQARMFVDTLIFCDGHIQKDTGVRRFQSSNPEIVRAFEIASSIAGYAISPPTVRRSELASKDCMQFTVSERNEIGVRRWGRDYKNHAKTCKRKHTGLELHENTSGRVWCVSVPSGLIVVRRHGFSMVCGNCAQSAALRESFPTTFGGMFLEEEPEPLPDAQPYIPKLTSGTGERVHIPAPPPKKQPVPVQQEPTEEGELLPGTGGYDPMPEEGFQPEQEQSPPVQSSDPSPAQPAANLFGERVARCMDINSLTNLRTEIANAKRDGLIGQEEDDRLRDVVATREAELKKRRK